MIQRFIKPAIGNYYSFYINNGPDKGKTIFIPLKKSEIDLISEGKAYNYKAIPITSENLLEFNFIDSDGGHVFTLKEKGIMVWAPNDSSKEWTLISAQSKFEPTKVQFIHEIQNIYIETYEVELF